MPVFYGTLGPACAQADRLLAMLNSGMDGVRLNLSHGSLTDAAPWLDALASASARAGCSPALMIDVQGAELRTGILAAPIPLARGDRMCLGASAAPGVPHAPLSIAALPCLAPGQPVLIDDGQLTLTVLEADGAGMLCRVERGGVLRAHKSVALPGATLSLPVFCPADEANLACAARLGVTQVMLPFVRSAADIRAARTLLAHHGLQNAELFAKVEDGEGLAALPQWLPLADEVVIARGDLGMQLPLFSLPGIQQEIAAQCRAAGKRFMVVTQLLHSMCGAPNPTRAEVNDVAHAVWDGAASLMLTGETAAGAYPVESMRALTDIARTAQAYARNHNR